MVWPSQPLFMPFLDQCLNHEIKLMLFTYQGFHEKGSLSYLCALGIDRQPSLNECTPSTFYMNLAVVSLYVYLPFFHTILCFLFFVYFHLHNKLTYFDLFSTYHISISIYLSPPYILVHRQYVGRQIDRQTTMKRIVQNFFVFQLYQKDQWGGGTTPTPT